MTDTTLDVVAIGNALVDVLSMEPDEFVVRHDLARGAMTMVDQERSEKIYADMGPTTDTSGGSAANTIAGLASFGSSAGFVGRVHADELGRSFQHDLRSLGVRFNATPTTEGPPTGRCLVVVAPNAERTLCTYLGCAAELDASDLDAELLREARVTYVEGYLWDQPPAMEAIREAFTIAGEADRKVAMTLSDPFCVDRHRDDFQSLLDDGIDILFANEDEIRSLFEVDTFDEALQQVRGRCEVAALTRGPSGSVILTDGEVHVVDAHTVDDVVDTTGAGDLYAAGFLHGFVNGEPLNVCGELGSLAAAEAISHIGPRPMVSLAELAATSRR
ncbi:MAG: adenosine kinase [Acidimicrobiia bacterium]